MCRTSSKQLLFCYVTHVTTSESWTKDRVLERLTPVITVTGWLAMASACLKPLSVRYPFGFNPRGQKLPPCHWKTPCTAPWQGGREGFIQHCGSWGAIFKESQKFSISIRCQTLIVSPGSICRSSLARCAREAWPKCKASNFPRQVAQFLDKVWKAPARKKLMHAATPKPMTTWHDAEKFLRTTPPFTTLPRASLDFQELLPRGSG